jgi:hypothetical protein
MMHVATDSSPAHAEARQKEALLTAEALQSAILNSANFSSIATDAKGVIQIFNVGAERMLGYAAADVLNKITPAEMKKIDLARLAGATDATVEAVLDSYKARQPVIHTGIFGSIKAESAAQLAARVKGKEIAKLEAESRARFSSLKNNKTKLSGVPMDESTSSMGNMPVEQNVQMTDDEAAFDAFARMIRGGKDEDARQMFKQFAQKMNEPHPGSGSVVSMEEVQKSFDELCGDFDSMVRLAGKRSGVKL